MSSKGGHPKWGDMWGVPLVNARTANAVCSLRVPSLSIDCEGEYAALITDHSQLRVFSLSTPHTRIQSPEPFLPRSSKWHLSTCEWSPHACSRGLIASTSKQTVLVWEFGREKPHMHSLQMHTRPTSGLSWSPVDPNMLATCSSDTFVHYWDLRTPAKPAVSFCAWTAGASQVKCNRIAPHLLASSHDGEVRVWDTRRATGKGGQSTQGGARALLTAHRAKIQSLDWSHTDTHMLATGAQDSCVKLWNVLQPRRCLGTIDVGGAVRRVRFAPFGKFGLLTLSAGDSGGQLTLWSVRGVSDCGLPVSVALTDSRPTVATPVRRTFSGAGVVQEVDWRTASDTTECQLISLSRDQVLRAWTMDSTCMSACAGSENNKRPVRKVTADFSGRALFFPKEDSYASKVKLGNVNRLKESIKEELSILESMRLSGVAVEEAELKENSYILTICRAAVDVRLSLKFPDQFPIVEPKIALLPNDLVSADLTSRLSESLTPPPRIISPSSKHDELTIGYASRAVKRVQQCMREWEEEEEEATSRRRPSLPVSWWGTLLDHDSSDMSSPSLRFHSPEPDSSTCKTDDRALLCPRLSGASFGPFGRLVYFNNFTCLSEFSSFANLPRSYADLRAQRTNVKGARDVREDARETSVDGGGGGGIGLAGSDHEQTDLYDDEYASFFSPTNPTLSGMTGLGYPVPIRESPADSTTSINETVQRDPLHRLNSLAIDSSDSESNSGDVQPNTPPDLNMSITGGGVSINGVLALVDYACLFPEYRRLATGYVVQLPGGSAHDVCLANAQTCSHSTSLAQLWSLAALICTNKTSDWSSHPLGGQLASKLIERCQKAGDIQTAAMLACVLWKDALKSHAHFASLPSNRALQQQRDMCRFLYAEILYRLGEWEKRAEILSLISRSSQSKPTSKKPSTSPSISSRSIDLRLSPPFVNHTVPTSTVGLRISCGACRSDKVRCRHTSVRCVVCQCSVRGLLSCCVACGHGGHAKHMQKWFSNSALCASGCGCFCLRRSKWR
eukprot:444922_1